MPLHEAAAEGSFRGCKDFAILGQDGQNGRICWLTRRFQPHPDRTLCCTLPLPVEMWNCWNCCWKWVPGRDTMNIEKEAWGCDHIETDKEATWNWGKRKWVWNDKERYKEGYERYKIKRVVNMRATSNTYYYIFYYYPSIFHYYSLSQHFQSKEDQVDQGNIPVPMTISPQSLILNHPLNAGHQVHHQQDSFTFTFERLGSRQV